MGAGFSYLTRKNNIELKNMKLLVVDDSQKKIADVKELLSSLDIKIDFEIAQSAFDATRLMQKTSFDLVILDILLPNRPENEPSVDASIALLDEIRETTNVKKPLYLVGLTAYEDVFNQVEPAFKDALWTILKYDSTSESWKKSLKSCIEYVSSVISQDQQPNYMIDLAIVTATPKETKAVHALPWEWGPNKPIDDSLFLKEGSFKCKSRPYTAISVATPKMGMVAASTTVTKIIHRYRPRFIVMVGICGGLESETDLGEVIFADSSWDYQCGKTYQEDETVKLLIEPHQLHTPNFISTKIKQMQEEKRIWQDIKESWPGPAPSTELQLKVGPLASGSAVLSDGKLLKNIKEQQHRKILGVDMEIYGLYAACNYSAHPKPTFFALKSVSDYCDCEKSDHLQAYSAYTSTNAMKCFFENYMNEIYELAGTA